MFHVYTYFWYAQLIVICLTSAIGLFVIGFNAKRTSEKKYLLPYCCINSIVMLLLSLDQYFPQYQFYPLYIICIWVFFELLFITFYLNEKMGNKNKIFFTLIIYLITVFLSAFIFRSQNSLAFLITNLLIGIYLFKYFIWIFKIKFFKDLPKTPEYYIIQGISICYLGSIPFFIGGFFAHLSRNDFIRNEIQNLHYTIYISLNISMYLFFLIAFIKQRNIYKNEKILNNKNISPNKNI